MDVWIDVQTPKEVHYFNALRDRLLQASHRVIVTARDYDHIHELLQMYNVDHTIVGRHGGKSLAGKLKASLEREKDLYGLFEQRPLPDYCVSLASPEASRVSFGLDIKSVVSIDAPHAEAVCRLTLPLASYVIAPACIGRQSLTRFGVRDDILTQYDGVDEVAWIRGFDPDPKVPNSLGLKDGKYVVIRTEEAWASYLLKFDMLTESQPLIQSILDEAPEYSVVVFPRYPEQSKFLKDLFGDRIIVPDGAVDAPSLMAYATLVMSGGGTMDREACLMGVPAISFFPLKMPEVEAFLMERGFPIRYSGDVGEASREALKTLKSASSSPISRTKVDNMLNELENPIDKILELFD